MDKNVISVDVTRRTVDGGRDGIGKYSIGSSENAIEVYSNMNLKRVSQDFPTIVSGYVNEVKIGESYTKKSYTLVPSMTYLT